MGAEADTRGADQRFVGAPTLIEALTSALRLDLQLRARPILGPLAAIAAAAAGGLVSQGMGVPADLGAGIARFVPFVDIALAAIIAALLVLSPWEGLLSWVVLMPVLNMARAQLFVGPIQLILPSVFIPALLIGWLAGARRSTSGEGEASGRDVSTMAWGVALAVAVLALASAASARDIGGLNIVLHGLIEPALLGAVTVSLRPTRRQIVALLICLGLSVGLASVYSVLRDLRMTTSFAQAEAQRVNLARFTYYNVGIFGDLLAMALPPLAAAVLARRRLGLSRPIVLLVVGATAISLAALYLTFSKSAWLGVVLGLAVVGLGLTRGLLRRSAVVALTLLALTLVVPYPIALLRAVGLDPGLYASVVGDVQGQRLSSWDPGTPEGEVSITERVLAIEAGLRMAAANPPLGVGPGRFAAEYAGPYHPAGATRPLISAHNALPELAAEYGLPMAIVALVAMVVVLLQLARIHRSRDGPEAVAAIMIIASLLAFAVVASTFGLDFYRAYRLMNSDVIFVGLLLGTGAALIGASAIRPASSGG